MFGSGARRKQRQRRDHRNGSYRCGDGKPYVKSRHDRGDAAGGGSVR